MAMGAVRVNMGPHSSQLSFILQINCNSLLKKSKQFLVISGFPSLKKFYQVEKSKSTVTECPAQLQTEASAGARNMADFTPHSLRFALESQSTFTSTPDSLHSNSATFENRKQEVSKQDLLQTPPSHPNSQMFAETSPHKPLKAEFQTQDLTQ